MAAFGEKAAKANPGLVRTLENSATYGDSIQQVLGRLTLKQQGNPVSDLPLVEVSKQSKQGVLAVVYSGDGGWRDIDRTLGDYLAKREIAVLGVDTLRYFWKKRTPGQVGQDLTRIIEYYLDAWKLNDVWLVGYSFGADILPFAYNRLPESMRSRVVLMSLLSPGLSTDFEVHVSGWLGAGPGPEALPIMPEFARVPRGIVQCIYGEEEAGESLCVRGDAQGQDTVKIAGGHHFDGDYATLGQRLLDKLLRRLVSESRNAP